MSGKFCLRHYVGDGVVCLILVFLLIFGFILSSVSKDDTQQVRILRDGEEIAVYKLSDSASLYVDGVHIRLRDGKAVIESSDCPDKVCTEMRGVDKNGGGAVCIPNKIVLEPYSKKIDSVIVAG